MYHNDNWLKSQETKTYSTQKVKETNLEIDEYPTESAMYRQGEEEERIRSMNILWIFLGKDWDGEDYDDQEVYVL